MTSVEMPDHKLLDVHPLPIVFIGTADLACASLSALAQAPGIELLCVVAQPDRPKGRDLKLQPPPTKVLAEQFHIPVFQPEKLRHESSLSHLFQFKPDLIVVAAYGQILPAAVLSLPAYGCINVHASLLPQYRGAAPIQWAIINDESETGVTIMKLDEGLDTGPIVSQRATLISPQDNAQVLHDRLAGMGAELLIETIPGYIEGRLSPQAQDGSKASYARKISKEDGLLDWHLPARALWNRIRALNPWPGTFTFLEIDGKIQLLRIWMAEVDPGHSGQPGVILRAQGDELVVACQDHALRLLSVQREGKRRLGIREFLAGAKMTPGHSFLNSPK
jgi:methionyl-tRNA formyltransferase